METAIFNQVHPYYYVYAIGRSIGAPGSQSYFNYERTTRAGLKILGKELGTHNLST